MSMIASSLMGIILAMPVAPVPLLLQSGPVETHQENWVPRDGDSILVDTKENEGYLIHEDKEYIKFPVVTGQHRFVHYIGRFYDATTPTWSWSINELAVKGDRVTFGKEGRFLRMYKDGEEHTSYGFHEHRDEKGMFSDDPEKRYRSMGCVIVRHDIMDILVQTFEQNGSIDVTTQYGVDDVENTIVANRKTEDQKL